MRLGLIADTHAPYRAPAIPAAAVEALRGVDLILHAGDVDDPAALAPLWALAPVYAVRGNYHLQDGSLGGANLPEYVELNVEGYRLILNHGHLRPPESWIWKIRNLFRQLVRKWEFPAFEQAVIARLGERFPQADLIVFGHTHRFRVVQRGKLWLINPGAALTRAYLGAPPVPSVAHLVLTAGRPPEVQRIALKVAPKLQNNGKKCMIGLRKLKP